MQTPFQFPIRPLARERSHQRIVIQQIQRLFLRSLGILALLIWLLLVATQLFPQLLG